MKIVSIGAHPDDIELGSGGTLAKHKARGDVTHVILCTLGGVCGDPKQREREASEATRILGVKKLWVLDYPVSKLNKPSIEFEKIIEKLVDDIGPTRVYTHSPFDHHQVHVGVSKSVLRAADNVNQILYYETISSTTLDFKPNAFIDITKFIDLKIKSINMHKSQSFRFYLQPNVVKSLANTRYVWGKVGTNPKGLAEAFRIQKFIL
ncbi:MAG TPA: PIG-L deacetylase family protein [Candidatus Bathyarchaeia archaeon]|nr:PIG-L deacetylase family protein [Candidatus Bathyarchaeia archaeon]